MNINYRPPEDIRFDLEMVKDYPFYAADDPTNVRVEKDSNQIKGGTLPKIIERLTHHKTPDGASLPTFLATYRTFTTPHEVLDLLIWRYSMPACRDRSPDVQTKFKELMLIPVTTRVFNVLKLWVEKHYYDFEADPELKKKLINFIETKLAGTTWQGLMKNLIAKKEGQPGLVSAGSTLTRKEKPPAPILTCTCPPNFTPTIFDYHPEEVGRQMTLMLHDLYVQIRPPEFITMAQKFRRAQMQAKQAHDPELYLKAPNGMALQSAANRIRNWLESEVQASRRSGSLAPLISQLLDIATCCSRLNNHLTLKTIISVLEKTYIKELQPVWMSIEIDKRKFFFDNKELMSRNNYAKYKERLKTLSPPAVPYLATFLEEIAMIEDDLPDIVSERMINFQKKHSIGELLVKLQAMQSIPYMLVIVDPIQNLITRVLNGTPPQSPQLLSMSGSFMRGTEANMVRFTEVPADEVKRSLIELVQNDTEMKTMLRTLITETLSEEMAQLNLLLRSDSN
jgi:son of sevenless-like protein